MPNPSVGRSGKNLHSRARAVSVCSLPVDQWPTTDRNAWTDACRPGMRLKRGGTASHLKPVTQDDLARRYGYFLDFLNRSDILKPDLPAAAQITPDNVESYLAVLRAGVSSVTQYGSIYKLRRLGQLIAPKVDFSWLIEIENDLALVMQPRSKQDRLVLAEVLTEAGMTLMCEADASTRPMLSRARQFRDGLMIALLATMPIRLKNFAALEIGRSFALVRGRWWIVLTSQETKEKRADERVVPNFLLPWVEQYLRQHRPILDRSGGEPTFLWLSSRDGSPLTYNAVERILSKRTLATVGVDVSPHLFRTSGASTAAVYGGHIPHLASALLHHTDPRVAERHYNRATSMNAAQAYGAIVNRLRRNP
jgi:site-specific recombinase XerD